MRDRELLPCPFCGGEPFDHAIGPHTHSDVLREMLPGLPDHPGSHVIECACGTGFIEETFEACAAKWNRRAASEQKGNQ